jgi:(1->4)-alpha-D-glucan 1-alpha-D-glucosylmutase
MLIPSEHVTQNRITPVSRSLETAARSPRATYRLQLSPSFGFDRAAEVLPYLTALGVSHVYLSPYLASTPDSAHGYDIVDPERVREELGGDEGRVRFVARMKALGLKQMIDIVPNHLGIDSEHNRYFWDVLERGRDSEWCRFFDIDWDAHGDGKLVLPILPMPFDVALTERHITLRPHGKGVAVFVGERALPLSKQSQALVADAAGLSRAKEPEGLRALLHQQHYRLRYFRDGLDELNYRRFLDIASLAATAVEDPEVFAALHERVISWVADGSVSAIRVDHPDGLTDPEGYFLALRRAAPNAWIVAEKITAPGESLPQSWPVDGTTGYELLRLTTGMFVEPQGLDALSSTYASFVRRSLPDFDTLLWQCKHHALERLLGAETRRINRVLASLTGVADDERSRAALCELVANLETGRTYGRPGERLARDEQDQIRRGLARAIERRPDLEDHLHAITDALTLRPVGEACLRFQQLTSAAHAKGLEDTAFYRYGLLVAVNEVGLDPTAPAYNLSDFHRILRKNREAQPQSLLCTSTHDTKRGEDTRLRILALSEIPEAWQAAVEQWAALLERQRPALLDREMEYFILQTLVGVWPISEERLLGYVHKATREARRETSWLEPNLEYEAAVRAFVRSTLGNKAFIASLERFLEPVLATARQHALTQTLVKLTAPGVPDIYQGAELWDHSLVDPDNRRAVDFGERARLLAELRRGMPLEAIRGRSAEGLEKLWVVLRALDVRRERPASLAPTAQYEALLARDDPHGTVLAYQRGTDVIVVAPRFVLRHDRARALPTIHVPEGEWHNELTGERIQGGRTGVSELLARFPVALLTRRI